MPLNNRTNYSLLCWVLFVFSYIPASNAAAIEGYLSSFSVAQGESIDIHASTSDAAFSIEIYKDSINDFQLISTIAQITGNHNHSTPEEDAWLGPDWPVAYTLSIPLDWESGLYLIKLKSNGSSEELSVVVKENDFGSTSNILVFDSAPTRVAYNIWGGKSFYASTIENEPGEADFVSLKRPGQNVTRNEVPKLSRWIQFQELPVEWASMLDLHHDPALLDNYNVVVFVGHNEYWTREMRDNYDSFVSRGGNAVILSGNTMWWQVRIEGDRLICYKSNYQDDPMYDVDNSLVTTLWFASPVNEPENTSTGVSWRNGGYVNSHGYFTEADGYGGYTVVNSYHWIYDGTNLQDYDSFGQENTIVGHETDGAVLDWPDGKLVGTPVVTGTDDTPLSFTVLGYSEAFNGWDPQGIGYSTMGIFQGQNGGGFVFNAATVDWADGLWSLEQNTIADAAVSQITYNVISEFSNLMLPITFKNNALPDSVIGSFYSGFIRVLGGEPGYTWAISNGSLPAGLTLNSATGELSGTPVALGSSTFDVTVIDDLETNISATFTMLVDAALTYEDAEDGTTTGWGIYTGNSAGASISNEYDTDLGSQVIVLSGFGQDHGYDFRDPKWNNSEQFVVQWSMQFSELYTVFIDVQTSDGHKYLYYTSEDKDRLGTGEYIHHGLGTSSINGQWQTFTRDLQADLGEAQPGVVIEEVNGFLIRGSGRLDDIKLLNAEALWVDTASLSGGLISVPYSAFIQVSGGKAPYSWSLSNNSLPTGLTLNSVTGEISGIPDALGSSTFNVTVTDDSQGSISATFTVAVLEAGNGLVYEDAEDGNTLGWRIYSGNSASAIISNVFDTDRGSKVIVLSGLAQDHGYRLGNDDNSNWQNSGQFVLQWSMQFSESYTVFIDVQTTDGHKYLYYRPDDNNRLGTGEYIHHGLGASSKNGQWKTFTRDLQADLEEAQPGVVIEEVNGFLIRGSGRLDDIKLLNAEPLGIETASLSGGLLSVPYSAFIQVSGGKVPYNWTLSNGSLPTGLTLNSATGEISGTPDTLGTSTFDVTVTDDSQVSISATFTMEVDTELDNTEVVYEDAENGNTLGWRIYSGNSAGASISNTFDTDWDSKVIVLNGSGQDHGYRLGNDDNSTWQNSEQFVIVWSMQFSESYTVFIDVQTTDGHKYLYYRPDDNSRLGTGEYIHLGLGTSSINGLWQTFTRDLQADLEEAQPGVLIEEVNGFLIRGSGRLDDVKLL
ncbi:putative Ig domain-containing protein [Moritella sp. 24]|uniref:Ig domain-containing protein n=1 Tax=Moritella sp. 24 TaxID=2746230 RepID=UPI001BA5C979|nr:Ig domain-containing protein [Moritella sp. 24]QUM75962.1 putative Ig domain-containing protein [Moritella sp. 24]